MLLYLRGVDEGYCCHEGQLRTVKGEAKDVHISVSTTVKGKVISIAAIMDFI
jgi:hypothetical protein